VTRARHEPIAFRWGDGCASMGCLVHLGWRIRTRAATTDEPDVRAAVTRVFEAIFCGVPAGYAAATRSPLVMETAQQRYELVSATVFRNGWHCFAQTASFTVGDHAELLPLIVATVASMAEETWACGVAPVPNVPLAARFSFTRFTSTDDIAALCRELEVVLNARLAAHPSPVTAFEQAMHELKAAGHDLWSWSRAELWSHDHVTVRSGAGLRVTRHVEGDGDEDIMGAQHTVAIEFTIPDGS